MCDHESTGAEKKQTIAQPAKNDIGEEIENALSFLDSEVHEKTPFQKAAHVTESKPAPPITDSANRVQQEDLSGLRIGERKTPPPKKIQEQPARKAVAAPEAHKGKNIWFLVAGLAILIILAVVFLF